MNTELYTYRITTWTEAEPEQKYIYGKGAWDAATARARMMAAIRRTDKVPGLFATGTILTESEAAE